MMFKNIYEKANQEIKTPDSLKTSTLQKMLGRIKTDRRPKYIIGYASALAVVAIVLCITLIMNNLAPAYAIAAPQYPGKISFNDYEEKFSRREEMDKTFLSNLKVFSFKSSSNILKESDPKVNSLYSPISLYMALAMMAETAKGDTREEILKAMNMDNMDMVSGQTGKLFRSLYFFNEIGRLNLVNSLWLNDKVSFNKTLLDKMASDYYAHSFKVNFSSKDTPEKISKWVSEYTGGKLGNNADEFVPNPDGVMTLLNTVYFYDEWVDKFDTGKTAKDTFHLADGSTVKCDFMNMAYGSHGFTGADGFTASSLPFKNNGSMVFILPDEGVSPYDIISDPQRLAEAIDSLSSDRYQSGQVIFKIPKFNFSAKLDLMGAMKELGIKNAFNMGTADFTPLSQTKPLFVSGITQSAAISIDEKGCEAAAFTEIDYAGSAIPKGKAEMILDRPFIFAITGVDGSPLFIGVINNPTA